MRVCVCVCFSTVHLHLSRRPTSSLNADRSPNVLLYGCCVLPVLTAMTSAAFLPEQQVALSRTGTLVLKLVEATVLAGKRDVAEDKEDGQVRASHVGSKYRSASKYLLTFILTYVRLAGIEVTIKCAFVLPITQFLLQHMSCLFGSRK